MTIVIEVKNMKGLSELFFGLFFILVVSILSFGVFNSAMAASGGGSGGMSSPVMRNSPCDSYGDVDNDSYVSSVDSDLISDFSLGIKSPEDWQEERGDVNNDGELDAEDVLKVSQYYEGEIDTFKVCPEEEEGDCSDSDEGKNYSAKGKVENCSTSRQGLLCSVEEDECLGENELREYYCENSSREYKDHECSGLCKNGSCVEGKNSPCNSYGDVNDDGYVSSQDSDLISDFSLEKKDPEDWQLKRGDVNEDGKLDAEDVLKVSQYYEGEIDTFEVCTISCEDLFEKSEAAIRFADTDFNGNLSEKEVGALHPEYWDEKDINNALKFSENNCSFEVWSCEEVKNKFGDTVRKRDLNGDGELNKTEVLLAGKEVGKNITKLEYAGLWNFGFNNCSLVKNCEETDKGGDPETPGSVSYKGSYNDSCSNGNLTEYYCSSQGVKKEEYNCSLYCKKEEGVNYKGTCSVDSGMGYCSCEKDVDKNVKEMDKYSNKQAFLVSDQNWKRALSLVPVTTWTQEDEVNQKCQRGYQTAEGVCSYPNLIYHKEERKEEISTEELDPEFSIASTRRWREFSGVNKNICDQKNDKLWITNFEFLNSSVRVGERIYLNITITNCNKTFSNSIEGLRAKFERTGWQNQFFSIYKKTYLGEVPAQKKRHIKATIKFKKAYSEGFDADSVIYFLQQYDPNSLKVVGGTPDELDNLLIAEPEVGAGMEENQITRIGKDNYINYWKSYDDVVYVKDNYETALLASNYASLINAPLLIEGYNDNINLENKNVICVGNVDKNCDKKFTKRELQREYIEKTNTEKLIMTNPQDWEIHVKGRLEPEKSSKGIISTHTKDSLSSPILASSKHELLVFITSDDWKAKDEELENKIKSFETKPEYLTIISSPEAIKMDKKPSCSYSHHDCTKDYFEEVDRHIYGDLNGDNLTDMSTGRIYGLTPSDTISYISRDLFYEEILDTEKFANIWEPNFPNDIGAGKKMDKLLNKSYKERSIYVENNNGPTEIKEENVENKFWLSYMDHGWIWGGGGSYTTSGLRRDNIWLSPSTAFTNACSTCAYGKAPEKNGLFCTNMIRRGAIAHFGAVEVASLSWDLPSMVLRRIMEGKDIGTAFKEAENLASIDPISYYDPYYVLLGDPTFEPVFTGKLPNIPKDESVRVEKDKKDKEIAITYPSKKLDIKLDFPFNYDTQMKGYLSPQSFGKVILRDYTYNYTTLEEGEVDGRGENAITSLAFHKPSKMDEIKRIELFINGKQVSTTFPEEETCESWICQYFYTGEEFKSLRYSGKYSGKVIGRKNRDLLYMKLSVNSEAIENLKVKKRKYVIHYD